jgi:hypothetical protein
LNPHLDEIKVRDIRQSYLTSRTSCSSIYNIEYKLYIRLYDFFVK